MNSRINIKFYAISFLIAILAVIVVIIYFSLLPSFEEIQEELAENVLKADTVIVEDFYMHRIFELDDAQRMILSDLFQNASEKIEKIPQQRWDASYYVTIEFGRKEKKVHVRYMNTEATAHAVSFDYGYNLVLDLSDQIDSVRSFFSSLSTRSQLSP